MLENQRRRAGEITNAGASTLTGASEIFPVEEARMTEGENLIRFIPCPRFEELQNE